MEDDKDWDNFIQSTKEPDEVVDPPQDEDETLEDEELKDDDQDESQESDEDSDEGKSKGEPKSKPKDPPEDNSKETPKEEPEDGYKPRLTQFFDNGKPNFKKLEEAYINSGQEYERLNEKQKEMQDDYQKLMDAIGKNPKIAEELFGKDGAKQLQSQAQDREKEETTDPVLRHLKADIKRKNTQQYHEFVKDNPEALSDERKDKINRFLGKYSAQYQEDNDGAMPEMKDALEAAYRVYGWELASEQKAKDQAKADNREQLASAAKKTASSRTSPNSRKKPKKSTISKMEAEFADKLRVKL